MRSPKPPMNYPGAEQSHGINQIDESPTITPNLRNCALARPVNGRASIQLTDLLSVQTQEPSVTPLTSPEPSARCRFLCAIARCSTMCTKANRRPPTGHTVSRTSRAQFDGCESPFCGYDFNALLLVIHPCANIAPSTALWRRLFHDKLLTMLDIAVSAASQVHRLSGVEPGSQSNNRPRESQAIIVAEGFVQPNQPGKAHHRNRLVGILSFPSRLGSRTGLARHVGNPLRPRL
jgi:hypothetical protein